MAERGDAREQLLSAAEHLFAAKGLEGVSLREITAASGARNANAVHYHFGDRAGLITAVLHRHGTSVETRRHALLDAYEAAARDDLRALAGALVRPLASELDVDGGAGYLRVLADLATGPRPIVDPYLVVGDPRDASIHRWRRLVRPLLEAEAVSHHRRFLVFRFTVAELARRAGWSGRSDHRLFTSDLVDLVHGLLAAPVSEETKRLSSQRARTR